MEETNVSTQNNENTPKGLSRKGMIITASVVGALLVIYLVGSIFFQSHYLPRTVINGVSATGKTSDGLKKTMIKNAKDYKLTIVERDDKKETIKGEDISLEVEFDDTLEKILKKQNGFTWVAKLFKPEIHESDSIVSYDQQQLQEQMQQLDCMKAENMKAPENATVKEDKKEGYVVVPEVLGTTVNTEVFWEKLNSSVLNIQKELVMDKEKCYVDPTVTEDSKELKTAVATLKKIKDIKITYTFGDKSEVLEGKEISKWMKVVDGKAQVDDEQALAYVKSLASKYNTVYKPKTLKTSWGSTVTISNGSYGWKINNAEETEQLKADILEAKDVTREPVYSQRANSHGENDYGNTYVEINLTAQHLYFYKDGKLIVDTDFVSGNPSKGNATPVGAYPVTYTEKNATLRGADYESKVTYWMPYCGNVGMHDASWRNRFGGAIYKRNGSHGCVNLPTSAAKIIFENIAAGYPVLVYQLPGTESSQAQAMDQADAVIAAIDSIGDVNLGSGGVISSCRSKYDGLSEDAKKYVTNYDVLVAAESTYGALQSQENARQESERQEVLQAQGQANAVIDLINQIGPVNAGSGDAIQRARNAYNALSDRAKSYVTNYGTLQQAEASYAAMSQS